MSDPYASRASTVPQERKKVKRPAIKSHTPTHKNSQNLDENYKHFLTIL